MTVAYVDTSALAKLVLEEPVLAAASDAVLARVQQLPPSQAVVKAALSPRGLPTLRTLDLLHLLTARAARDELGATTLIGYDQELLDAARAEGFTVLAPA